MGQFEIAFGSVVSLFQFESHVTKHSMLSLYKIGTHQEFCPCDGNIKDVSISK